jgi:hypothetical protein
MAWSVARPWTRQEHSCSDGGLTGAHAATSPGATAGRQKPVPLGCCKRTQVSELADDAMAARLRYLRNQALAGQTLLLRLLCWQCQSCNFEDPHLAEQTWWTSTQTLKRKAEVCAGVDDLLATRACRRCSPGARPAARLGEQRCHKCCSALCKCRAAHSRLTATHALVQDAGPAAYMFDTAAAAVATMFAIRAQVLPEELHAAGTTTTGLPVRRPS